MKLNKKLPLIISCSIIVLFLLSEVITFSKSWTKAWDKAKANSANKENLLEYKLSLAQSHDDSIFIMRINELSIEAESETERIRQTLDSAQKIHCEILLSHARTMEDSVLVTSHMLAPVKKRSVPEWKNEMKQRIGYIRKQISKSKP